MTCKIALLVDSASENDLKNLTRRLSNELSKAQMSAHSDSSVLLIFSSPAEITDAYNLIPHLDAVTKLFQTDSPHLKLSLFAALEDRLLLITRSPIGPASIPVNQEAYASVVANWETEQTAPAHSPGETELKNIVIAMRKGTEL